MFLGTNVVSLFPSMSAEKTGIAVRRQIEKSQIKFEEIDHKWLSLYIHLNRGLCSNIREINHLLPKRRPKRRGREAGMGSEECSKRFLEEKDTSNWVFPDINPTQSTIKKLMGAASTPWTTCVFLDCARQSGN